jgi:hypothetical protein
MGGGGGVGWADSGVVGFAGCGGVAEVVELEWDGSSAPGAGFDAARGGGADVAGVGLGGSLSEGWDARGVVGLGSGERLRGDEL